MTTPQAQRESAVAVQEHDAVLTVTLNRAAKLNAVDPAMAHDLADALDRIDESVGALLILADGENFCGGGDVGAFAAAECPDEFVGGLADAFHAVIRRLAACEVPVVIGVRGWAAGAGLSLAACGDLVVCGPSTRFRSAYTSLGLTPDGGMSWILPRVLGPARAMDVLLADRLLTAEEALAAGLVSRVVADEQVDTEAAELARRLAHGPRQALAATRHLVRQGLTRDLDRQLDAEAAQIALAAGRAEGREGVQAYVQRRAPNFPQ